MRWLQFPIVLFFLAACAADKSSAGRGIPLHGNFCGPFVPDDGGGSVEDRVARLSSNWQPIDSVDRFCQEHDICYVRNGFLNHHCDRRLMIRIQPIYQRIKERAWSTNFADKDPCFDLVSTIFNIMWSSQSMQDLRESRQHVSSSLSGSSSVEQLVVDTLLLPIHVVGDLARGLFISGVTAPASALALTTRLPPRYQPCGDG